MNRLAPAILGLTLLAAATAHAQPGQGMRGADADGDGVITAAELEASALQRFQRSDANGDGVVDAGELQAIRQRLEQREGAEGGPPAGFGGRMLAQLVAEDADKDGRVTKGEALAASRARFATADKNADGKLTSDEFRIGPPPR